MNNNISKDMKVYVLTSAKTEELYIEYFVNYYLNLGIDKIIINDNNDKDYPYQLKDILKKYIDNGTVIIENYFEKNVLHSSNSETELGRIYGWLYNKYKNEFNWCIRCDIDEYLEIPEFNNIKDFLNQSKFNDFYTIEIFWLTQEIREEYKLKYIHKSLPKRFSPTNYIREEGIKPIIRGNLDIILTHHQTELKEDLVETNDETLINCQNIRIYDDKKHNKKYIHKMSTQCLADGNSIYNLNLTVNNCGELVHLDSLKTVSNNEYVYKNTLKYAYFNHYRTPSLEELIIKNKRLYKDTNKLYNKYCKYVDKTGNIRDLYKIYFLDNK